MSDMERLHGTEILRGGQADVATFRERARQRRVRRVTIVLWAIAAWMSVREVWGQPLIPAIPISQQMAPSFVIVGLLMFVVAIVLLFKNRYREDVFDVAMGFNRWAMRVCAYGVLMTPVYPPFRFDPGAREPAAALGGTPVPTT